MLKVLVVDDDKLVRKGLISAMPWTDFNMQVVGEAANGEKALEFLKANPVDLLVTDLSMPVMSGLELMKIARQWYPGLYMTVLTVHHDFEYIQEALRLGAIDYISKVQLEKERFDEVLGRIRNRIEQEAVRVQEKDAQGQLTDRFVSDVGYAVFTVHEQADPIDDLQALGLRCMTEVDNCAWLWIPPDGVDERAVLSKLADRMQGDSGRMIVKMDGLKGEDKEAVYRSIRRYRSRHFFYDYNAAYKMISRSVHQLNGELHNMTHEEEALLHKRWISSLEWIYNKTLFHQLQNELGDMRPTIPKLIRLLHGITYEWNRIYGSLSGSEKILPGSFHVWHECRLWLETLRETAVSAMGTHYSSEVVGSVMAAVKLIQEEMDQQIYATQVAKRVNMSRSYFNQCFKNIVGHTFNEYVRLKRIETAKEYLVQTSKPIRWIAERTGYLDEKYFSRVFREQTGLLPSEYRQEEKSGTKRSAADTPF